ncbi:MAG: flavin-containing monooxygenase [Candidatus Levyibacteriota bacterium]
MNNHFNDVLDCIIIGGGQSGLAASYACKKRNLSHVVLDAHSAVGDSWRQRYDSLHLFTPRSLSALDGMVLTGKPNGYPSKDEMADYFTRYVKKYKLPVKLNQKVSQLQFASENDRRFTIITEQGTQWHAKAVIVATGPFQVPFVPSLATKLHRDIQQLHSSDFHNRCDVRGSRILVVGGGNSGAQIAAELAETGKEVTIAVAHPLNFVSPIIFGKSLFGWQKLVTSLILSAPTNSRRGKYLYRVGVPIIGRDLKRLLKHGQVKQRTAVSDIQGDEIIFADGTRERYGTVLWCTGFRGDYSWLRDIAGALNEKGLPLHMEGISPIPGLFYVGLEWQRSRASSLVMGASQDAEFVVTQLISSS